MARNKNIDTDEMDFSAVAEEVIPSTLSDEVEKSFLEYSYAVIYSRALPNARDGLKPVQRRLLYAMHQGGYTPDKSYVKSAKPVADTMGTFHPHGDTAIYEAMVRLAQPFSLYVPLVDGYGNFGDQPGAAAAASRYTEARLSKEALMLVSELREDTVEMRPNYGNTTTEPLVLPVQFPNLLVNGTTGIAVGMATNMPPHNPSEVIDGARYLLKHPDATLDKLMEYIPGPDFPTGGSVLGMDAVREAYETGRGTIRMRGTYTVENTGRGKNNIIFTQFPYGVNTEKIIEAVKKKMNENRLQGIADIKDLTDRRNGTRLVIEAKAGVNPEALVFDLFRFTPLEDSFGINNLALVNGEPTTLGLKALLQEFLTHRIDVVRRRTQFRRDKRANRLHLVEGLLKALADIDKVIAIVRKSEDANTAKETLIKTFKVDDIQADYILSLQLRRLTRFDQVELGEEKNTLEKEIAELDAILGDEDVLRNVISDELTAVKKALDTPRRSILVGGNLAEHLEEAKNAAKTTSLLVADKPCFLGVFSSGAVLRSEEPVVVSGRGKIDPLIDTLESTTRSSFIAVTNRGRAVRVESLHVAEGTKSSASNVGITLAKGERILCLAPNAPESGVLALGTKSGIIKTVRPEWASVRTDDFEVMALSEGDEILSGRWVPNQEEAEFAFLSSDTSLLHFPASTVRGQGRSGGGMSGFRLSEGAHIMVFSVLLGEERNTGDVITVTDAGFIKRTPFSAYPAKGRATGGVRTMALRKGSTGLTVAFVGASALLLDADGKNVPLPDSDPRRDGSGASITPVPVTIGRKA